MHHHAKDHLRRHHLKTVNAHAIGSCQQLANTAIAPAVRRLVAEGGAMLLFTLDAPQKLAVAALLQLIDELDARGLEPALRVTSLRIEPTMGRGGGGGVAETLYDALAPMSARRRPATMPCADATRRVVRDGSSIAQLLHDATVDAPPDSFVMLRATSVAPSGREGAGRGAAARELTLVLLPAPSVLSSSAASASFGDVAYAVRRRCAAMQAQPAAAAQAVLHGTSKLTVLLRDALLLPPNSVEVLLAVRVSDAPSRASEARMALVLAERLCGVADLPRTGAYIAPAVDPLAAFIAELPAEGAESVESEAVDPLQRLPAQQRRALRPLRTDISEASLEIAIQAERTAAKEAAARAEVQVRDLEAAAAMHMLRAAEESAQASAPEPDEGVSTDVDLDAALEAGRSLHKENVVLARRAHRAEDKMQPLAATDDAEPVRAEAAPAPSTDTAATQLQMQAAEQARLAQYWHGVVENLVGMQRKSALLRGLMLMELLRLQEVWVSWCAYRADRSASVSDVAVRRKGQRKNRGKKKANPPPGLCNLSD